MKNPIFAVAMILLTIHTAARIGGTDHVAETA
jgi:hypothetical protein